MFFLLFLLLVSFTFLCSPGCPSLLRFFHSLLFSIISLFFTSLLLLPTASFLNCFFSFLFASSFFYSTSSHLTLSWLLCFFSPTMFSLSSLVVCSILCCYFLISLLIYDGLVIPLTHAQTSVDSGCSRYGPSPCTCASLLFLGLPR